MSNEELRSELNRVKHTFESRLSDVENTLKSRISKLSGELVDCNRRYSNLEDKMEVLERKLNENNI